MVLETRLTGKQAFPFLSLRKIPSKVLRLCKLSRENCGHDCLTLETTVTLNGHQEPVFFCPVSLLVGCGPVPTVYSEKAKSLKTYFISKD